MIHAHQGTLASYLRGYYPTPRRLSASEGQARREEASIRVKNHLERDPIAQAVVSGDGSYAERIKQVYADLRELPSSRRITSEQMSTIDTRIIELTNSINGIGVVAAPDITTAEFMRSQQRNSLVAGVLYGAGITLGIAGLATGNTLSDMGGGLAFLVGLGRHVTAGEIPLDQFKFAGRRTDRYLQKLARELQFD